MVALLFAASPLVDAAFIPLGIMRYSAWKSVLSLYTGKFIWILTVLFAARTFHQVIIQAVGADTYAAIFSIGLVVSVAYLMIRIDWDKQVFDEKTRIGRLARRVKGLFSRSGSRNPASQAQRAQSSASD